MDYIMSQFSPIHTLTIPFHTPSGYEVFRSPTLRATQPSYLIILKNNSDIFILCAWYLNALMSRICVHGLIILGSSLCFYSQKNLKNSLSCKIIFQKINKLEYGGWFIHLHISYWLNSVINFKVCRIRFSRKISPNPLGSVPPDFPQESLP